MHTKPFVMLVGWCNPTMWMQL